MQSTGEVIGIHTGPPGRAGEGARSARRSSRRVPAKRARLPSSRSPTGTRPSSRGWGRPDPGRLPAGSDRRDARRARGGRLRCRDRSPSSARSRTRPLGEVAILELIAARRRPARRQHADATVGRRPGRCRDPPRGDGRGDPLPDRDRDRGRRRRGARSVDRGALVGRPVARRMGPARRPPVGRPREVVPGVTTAFDLVIFDCDGVLVDSERLSIRVDATTWSGSAGRCPRPRSSSGSSADPRPTCGPRSRRTSAGRSRPTSTRSSSAVYRETIGRRARGGRRHREAVLDAIPTAASASRRAATHAKIRRNLARTGLGGYFGDRIFSATDVAHGKPAPDLFLHAAPTLGAARPLRRGRGQRPRRPAALAAGMRRSPTPAA